MTLGQLKYIVFEGNELRYDDKDPVRKEMAIVFPYEVSHRQTSRAISSAQILPELKGAGFCRWTGMRFVCEGHSETLDLKSRGELDAVIINRILGIEP